MLAIVVWCAFSISKLKFSFDLERFFPDGDEDLSFYMDFRNQFSPDNDFILIGIKNNEGVFEQDFLNDLSSFTDSLEQLQYVSQVVSPTNVKNLIIGPMGAMSIPYVHPNDSAKFFNDSIRVFQDEKLVDVLFSKNGKSVCINLITERSLSKDKSDQLLKELKIMIDSYGFDEHHLAGRIPSQAYVISKMGGELALFMSISFVILVMFLIWLYRSFIGVFLPLIIVIFSTLILLGVLVLMNEEINLVITILPVVMFVVGTSDVIHVLSRYSAEKIKLENWHEALVLTFKEVGMATFLTSITTTIGFATLITASVYPVQRFGLVMAIGVMIAFVVTFLLLPSILYLIKDRWSIMKGGEGEFIRIKLQERWIDKVLGNKSKVFVGLFIVVCFSFYGINKLKVNNFLLDDLRESDKHMMDFRFFENEFSGVRPFEIALKSEKGLLDYNVQQEILKLELYLNNEFYASNIISPLFFTKLLNQATHGGRAEGFVFPKDEIDYLKQLKQLKRFENNELFKNYISENKTEGRISAKIKDEGRLVVKEKIEALERFVFAKIDSKLLKVKPTGTAMLIDKNAEHLAENMLQGLLIAFVVISLIVSVLFKSGKMVLISLIPNVLPLVMIAGFMGFVGIDLKASTIIIFTISFGIAVDDTIHFLSKFKIELDKGNDVEVALKNSFLSTGKAIVVTSIILFAGFASLMFSTFQSTFYIGLLISLTLLFALLSDLILLPVLIKTYFQKH